MEDRMVNRDARPIGSYWNTILWNPCRLNSDGHGEKTLAAAFGGEAGL
jgi:hypothetical protein